MLILIVTRPYQSAQPAQQIPQPGWCQQHTCTVSQAWRQEVWDPGGGRVGSSPDLSPQRVDEPAMKKCTWVFGVCLLLPIVCFSSDTSDHQMYVRGTGFSLHPASLGHQLGVLQHNSVWTPSSGLSSGSVHADPALTLSTRSQHQTPQS